MTPLIRRIVMGVLFLPSALSGQDHPGDPPRRLDAELFHLTGSWVWNSGGSWALGVEVGGGVLEQKTLKPSGDDFTALAHVGLVASFPVGERATADVGLRLGFGELRSLSCSGCIPDAYGATTMALFAGGRRVQVGSRFTVGTVFEESFLAWSPVVLRLRF